jgi:outer membrane protein assembly factor BamD (BamD/ComL family)
VPSLDTASAPARPPASPRKPTASGDSEAETKLVVAAGAALVRDNAEAALALTREHLARFPNGAHAEERDRIAIEALARLEGVERARAAADRFFLRYPQSIYRSRIESLLR